MYKESEESRKARGRALKAAALKAGYTAAEVADIVGCHINTVYLWFSDPSMIRASQMDAIATTLNIPEQDIREIFLPQYKYVAMKHA